jgi:prepilin peptidase CpaA
MSAAAVVSLAFPALLLWAAASDLARFEIPNAIPLALVMAFAAYAVAAGLPAAEVAWNCAVGALALAVGAGLFFARVLGGGDAKLIAAVAIWTGASGLPRFLVAMALVGGVLALGLTLYRLVPAPAWSWLRRLHARRGDAPYGVAIAGGGIAWYSAAILQPW